MMSAKPFSATQVASSAPKPATLSDDDDEIVYPVSSQSSAASTSPDLPEEDTQLGPLGTGSTVAPLREGRNNDNITNGRGISKNSARFKADSFLDDFVLERGDAGSKVWSPLPSVHRPRPKGRGHRSTKSESSLPVPALPREPPVALEPVKESWADDMKGLEAQMERASLGGTPARPRSTPAAVASRAPQSTTSSPKKQRSPKKQKAKHETKGTPPGAKNRSSSTKTNTSQQSYPSPPSSPTPSKVAASATATASNSGSLTKRKSKKGKSKAKAKKDTVPVSIPSTAPSTPRGLGRRSIVDDVSENGDSMRPPQSLVIRQSETDRLLGVAYDEAVQFMNDFIQNPDYYTSRASRLTFLQALIVELGLVSATGPERTLPGSLTAAKALLRSHAFLNVKDYLALREKGLDALRSAMRPSRSALVRDLRGRNGRRAKLGWVKETGLNVLLVSCQY